MSAHIVKKVADKLNSLYNTERETYETVWENIKIFVEYACMRDRKFYDRVKDSILIKLTDDSHTTVKDYLEAAKEKHENTVYYTTDKALQAQYISLFETEGIQVAYFDKQFEVQFLSMLEQYMEGIKFIRVDADVASALKNEGDVTENADLVDLFKEASGNNELKVKFENLKSAKTPALLNISEESRRLEEMMRMYGNSAMPMGMSKEETLVVNTAAPLVKKLESLMATDKDTADKIASYIYKLAVLSQRKLTAEEMTSFLEDSFTLLEQI